MSQTNVAKRPRIAPADSSTRCWNFRALLIYAAVASLVSYVPTLAVMVLLNRLHVDQSIAQQTPFERNFFAIGAIALSPAVETWFMGLGIALLRKKLTNVVLVSALSAAGWAIIHSLLKPVWGLVAAWGFFVLSVVYLRWSIHGRRYGYCAAFITHTLHNAMAIGVSLLW